MLPYIYEYIPHHPRLCSPYLNRRYSTRDLWTEDPRYRVVEKKDGYEIREYSSYIVAEVEVEGDMKIALNRGFRLLAGYIFGGNATWESVKMTAPVMETSEESFA